MPNAAKNIGTIEYRGVSKRFGNNVAVRDFTLTVKPGEIFGLIGPNGAGKTTLIKMACGLYRVDSGTIRIGGIDLHRDPTAAKARLGYVPDDPAAYDELTGREFLEFVGELHGMDRVVRDGRIVALLAEFRFGALADARFGDYSRGNRQKISLIAALLHAPSAIFVDEPMVGLDPESARTAVRLLGDFARGGGAVLVSTHSLPIAEKFCHRFGLLRAGRLVQEGTAAELRQRAGRAADLEEAYLRLVGA